ncbi:MAG: ribonuclease III [Rhodocyclaceae bacterium]|nr:ribonuclease III [Rhodocyclaceae bacterium]
MSIGRLEQALGYAFADTGLLLTALTHRSHGTPHNERLEFIGDSVLNCAIALELYRRFPQLAEGEMSRLRANLVRQETLHQIADAMGIGDCLRLGEGELKSGGHRRPSILADAVEALIGAVHLDGGFVAASELVARLYADRLAAIVPGQQIKDPKTRLQEYLQGRRLALPSYAVLDATGEAHAQNFRVCCEVSALRLRAEGHGPSRRAAEQMAAEKALEQLA